MWVKVSIRQFEYKIFCSNLEQQLRWLAKVALNRFERELKLPLNSTTILDVVIFPSRWQLFPDTPIQVLFSKKTEIPIARARRSNVSLRVRGLSLVAFGIGKFINRKQKERSEKILPHIKLYISDTTLDCQHKHNCRLLHGVQFETPAQSYFIQLQSLLSNQKPHTQRTQSALESVYECIHRTDGTSCNAIWQTLNNARELYVINNLIDQERNINRVYVELVFSEQSMVERFNCVCEMIICDIECFDQQEDHAAMPTEVRLSARNKFTHKLECSMLDIVNTRISFRKATKAELKQPDVDATPMPLTMRGGLPMMPKVPLLPLTEMDDSPMPSESRTADAPVEPEGVKVDAEYSIGAGVEQKLELHSARSHCRETLDAYSAYRGSLHCNADRLLVHACLTRPREVQRYHASMVNAQSTDLSHKLEALFSDELIARVFESEKISIPEQNYLKMASSATFHKLYVIFAIHANTSFVLEDKDKGNLPLHAFKAIWRTAKLFRFCWNFDTFTALLEYAARCRDVHDEYMLCQRFKVTMKEYMTRRSRMKESSASRSSRAACRSSPSTSAGCAPSSTTWSTPTAAPSGSGRARKVAPARPGLAARRMTALPRSTSGCLPTTWASSSTTRSWPSSST